MIFYGFCENHNKKVFETYTFMIFYAKKIHVNRMENHLGKSLKSSNIFPLPGFKA